MRDHDVHTDDALVELQLELLAGQPGSFIEQILPRANAGVPEWFVPSAAHVAVVTDRALHWVNVFSPRAYSRAHRWCGYTSSNERLKQVPEGMLLVRRYGAFWSVEREIRSVKAHEVLGFEVGLIPILHRNYKAAMTLAMRCHPACPQASPLRWLPSAGYLVEHPKDAAARNAVVTGGDNVAHG